MTSTRRSHLRLAAASALTVALVAATAGCGPDHVDRAARTGAEGKQSQLLAAWVPDDATAVRVKQRTTSSERLLTFVHAGALQASCTPVARPGRPSRDELNRAYAGDAVTRDEPLSDVATRPTYGAAWWPQDQERRTTALCGRWWVSHDGDRWFAWAPGSVADPR